MSQLKYNAPEDPRHKYKPIAKKDIMVKLHEFQNCNDDIAIEGKEDGSNVRIIIEDGSIRIWGSRLNKDGVMLEYTEKVPHLTVAPPGPGKREDGTWNNWDNLKLEELNGTILHGEVWHPNGQSFTAGMLNAKIPKALAKQEEHGLAQLTIFDIVAYKGKSMKTLLYNTRRSMYAGLCDDLQNVNILPARSYKKSDIMQAFNSEHEGLVIKDLNSMFDEAKWIKIKHVDFLDLEVIGVFDATIGSRLDGNGIGGIIVNNKGTEVRVGSGFTDEQRRVIFKYSTIAPTYYNGAIAMISAIEETDSGSLRSPVFAGWHLEKSPANIAFEDKSHDQ